MALFFGRVNKSDWDCTALFANVIPCYVKDIESDSPQVCAANGIPEWLFDAVQWIVCNIPMPYDGFMLSHVRKII